MIVFRPKIVSLAFAVFMPIALWSAAEDGSVSAKFASIYWAASDPDVNYQNWKRPEWYVLNGEKHEPIEVFLNQLGKLSHYEGPNLMELYERRLNMDGEWTYIPFTSVSIPQTSMFLLFITKGRAGYSATAFDVSESAIPQGDIAFLNLTGKKVAADIRGDRKLVEPWRLSLFTPTNSQSQELPLQLAVFNDEWERVYATVSSAKHDRSYLMVFYQPEGREDSYSVRIIRDLHALRR